MAEDGRIEQAARLFTGSFKGVPIFIESVSVIGGRKATPRPLINSDEQNVSDVGKRVRGYQVSAYVTALYRAVSSPDDPAIRSDYLTQRKAILSAIEKKGFGTFIHPWEGEVRGMICADFDLEEVMTDVGIGKLSMTLVKKTVSVIPAEQQGSKDAVQQAAAAADLSLRETIEQNWGVDLAFIDAAEDAIGKVQSAYDAVQAGVQTAENVASEINGFSSAITELTTDLASIITSPLDIAVSIQNAFTQMGNIFPTLDAKYSAMVSQFSFGDLDVEFDRTTPSAIQKSKNFASVNTSVKGQFLTNAYTAALDLDLTTVDEIDEVETTLDEQHQSIIDSVDTPPEVRDALENIRSTFSIFLSEARVNALQVVEEDISILTPRLLAFQFYGDDALSGQLQDLNSVKSFELISGTAKVLSS